MFSIAKDVWEEARHFQPFHVKTERSSVSAHNVIVTNGIAKMKVKYFVASLVNPEDALVVLEG
jgi:hypothetical protein